ncbi:hypothetical protein [Nocardia camponoti]|uniref:Uncharacterized protein n=1 Tax=Nocardia camponoti TaxID=1616106 RepID=A0A917VDT5_9NOCA|nr:hypothetical protein [Nocardia camponoti]GGK66821.1 hypothetical protein GCM10011591_43710 [Nocardia camponoti]
MSLGRRHAMWLVALLATAACATDPAGSPEVRHDLAPLIKRYPQLGTPDSATWMAWDNGDGRTVGLTTTWIQAVITLREETAAALRSAHALAPTQPYEMKPEIREATPPGTYLSAPTLNAAFSTLGWPSAAFLSADTPALIVLTVSS